jgi:hypothetical protein
MNFKISTAIGLGLVLTSTTFLNGSSTAQCRTPLCGATRLPDGQRLGRGNLPAIIQEMISKGDDFLRNEQYYLAKEQYSQALEQAKQIGNAEGEAIALRGLSEISIKTGNLKEASAHLTAEKAIYERLQNKQGINSVNRQLGVIRIQQRQLQQRQLQQFNR